MHATRRRDPLPAVPEQLRSALQGAEVLRLALVDKDAEWQPNPAWLVLTRQDLQLWQSDAEGEGWSCETSIDRNEAKIIERDEMLAGSRWQLRGPDDLILMELHASHWWRSAVEAVLESAASPDDIDEHEAPPEWEEVVGQWQRLAAAPLREKRAAAPESTRATWRRLAGYVRRCGRRVIAGLIAAIGVTALGLVPAHLIGRLVDDVVRPARDGVVAIEMAWRDGLWLLAFLAVALIARSALQWLRFNLLALAGERVAQSLRHDVFERLSRFELSWFTRQHSGAIISRVVADTDRIWELVAFGVIEGLLAVAMLLAVAAMLLSIDWQLGLLLLVPMPFFAWVLQRHSRSMRRLYTRAWRAWSRTATVIGDLVGGIAVVRAFRQGGHERARFAESSLAMNRAYLAVHQSWTRFVPLVLLVLQMITVLVYALALPRLLGAEGAPPLSTGQFVTVVMLLGLAVGPVEALAQMARMTDRSISSARRVFELMDAARPVAEDQSESIRSDDHRDRRLAAEVRDVRFAYERGQPVLRGIHLEIEKGDLIGLVGGSGTGKSTLLQLLARLYSPDSGTIALASTAREGGRSGERIGWVPQEPFLFSGSVWDNVTYGITDQPMEPPEIASSVRDAAAHDFVLRLPLGYDTPLGERGGRLSGGERQRLALARALACGPDLLLLDETTSQLDGLLEQRIIERLRARTRREGMAAVWVSHRLGALRAANRVAVLHGGRLVEQGDPADLCQRQDSWFLASWRQQHGDEPWLRSEPTAADQEGETPVTGTPDVGRTGAIEVDAAGRLTFSPHGAGKSGRAHLRVRPWFPLTRSGHWISLVDSDSGAEVWFGRDSSEFTDPRTRAAIDREWRTAVARPLVSCVTRIRETDELRTWHMRMSDGAERIFQCAADQWPERAPGGWWLRDLAGDIVWLPLSLRKDAVSWRQLWPYVDDDPPTS